LRVLEILKQQGKNQRIWGRLSQGSVGAEAIFSRE
jgi:hypothetical protein